ncbi:hypothetical protein MKW92_025923 [Papaver armeniacum]|nr:hypothetical protein MKW92_025923 [Papaver armeniacum]
MGSRSCSGYSYCSLGIVAYLIINSTVSFIEEENSGRTAECLMAHFPLKAKVRRGGRWKDLDAGHVVPGDVVRLKPGVIIPADVRLLEGDPVKIDRVSLIMGILVNADH